MHGELCRIKFSLVSDTEIIYALVTTYQIYIWVRDDIWMELPTNNLHRRKPGADARCKRAEIDDTIAPFSISIIILNQ